MSHHLLDQLTWEKNPHSRPIHPAAGMIYQFEHILLAALVDHTDFFQHAQCLTVNQFHLFRVERFIDTTHQTATVHDTSFNHNRTIQPKDRGEKEKSPCLNVILNPVVIRGK